MEASKVLDEVLVTDHLREHLKNEITPRRMSHTRSVLDLCKVLRAQSQLNRENLDILKANIPLALKYLLDQIYLQWMTELSNDKSNTYGECKKKPRFV